MESIGEQSESEARRGSTVFQANVLSPLLSEVYASVPSYFSDSA